MKAAGPEGREVERCGQQGRTKGPRLPRTDNKAGLYKVPYDFRTNLNKRGEKNGRKRGEKEEKEKKRRGKEEKRKKKRQQMVGKKKGKWKAKKKILPLRFGEAFPNRAWEGFQNRWNTIIHATKFRKNGQ